MATAKVLHLRSDYAPGGGETAQRALAEHSMIGALDTYDEASAIREEHRSKLEKTAEEEGQQSVAYQIG